MPRRLRPPTTSPPPSFFSFPTLLPSVHLSFRSRLFSPPPLSTTPLPSNFFSTPLALARCLRAIARKENRNIEVEPRECHLDDSCRFVHTYTRIRSLCLSRVRTHAEDVSSLPALARIRGVRYFCPRTRRFLIAHPWTVRFTRMLDDEVRLFRRKVVGIRGGVEIFLS